MKTIALPPSFFEDHLSRELPTPQFRYDGKRYIVDRDDPNLPELLSDAQHYAFGGLDFGDDRSSYLGLIRSAQATVAAIRKATD